VGRLEPVKYTQDLIKMFSICSKARNDLVLMIAGDGELKKGMKDAAALEGVRDAVVFLDRLPQEELKDLYITADVACFTSAGFTMIEAALAERCIIAYDFEWHSEFIGNNERGLLVPFGDTVKFAAAVLRAIGDRELRTMLGRNARDFALKNYSRRESINKEIGFYKTVLQVGG
jgi:glycosyltransferase involved in cell wall biosynthesis